MKLEDRMRQSIRHCRGNVVLRADVANLGSASQVSHALGVLLRKGELLRLGVGVYVKATCPAGTDQPQPLADFPSLAREAAQKLGVPGQPTVFDTTGCPPPGLVIATGKRRISRKLSLAGQVAVFVGGHDSSAPGRGKADIRRPLRIPTHGVADFVRRLAWELKVSAAANPLDQWAETVTRLAGDEVHGDDTENLLVALKRSGMLSMDEMTRLMVNHLRERKQGVRSV